MSFLDCKELLLIRLQVALLGHVFRLTFLSRQEIGQQHRLAKIATDAFVAAFPPAWHDLANYVDDEPHLVVTERQVLLGLVCTDYYSTTAWLIVLDSGARST
jgi:hypothetical protein